MKLYEFPTKENEEGQSERQPNFTTTLVVTASVINIVFTFSLTIIIVAIISRNYGNISQQLHFSSPILPVCQNNSTSNTSHSSESTFATSPVDIRTEASTTTSTTGLSSTTPHDSWTSPSSTSTMPTTIHETPPSLTSTMSTTFQEESSTPPTTQTATDVPGTTTPNSPQYPAYHVLSLLRDDYHEINDFNFSCIITCEALKTRIIHQKLILNKTSNSKEYTVETFMLDMDKGNEAKSYVAYLAISNLFSTHEDVMKQVQVKNKEWFELLQVKSCANPIRNPC